RLWGPALAQARQWLEPALPAVALPVPELPGLESQVAAWAAAGSRQGPVWRREAASPEVA
ncbi:MAG: hypothetical protein OXI70_09985, partial [Chloroflexota bacterium]|nr:hypothetical protein [Chloroflexota bacterium]